MRLLFTLLVAALLLPNIHRAQAGSPDYAVTFLRTDLDIVIGQQAVPLDVEITNKGEPGGYLPKFWIFLLDEAGTPPAVNWNSTAEASGAVGELAQGFPDTGESGAVLRSGTLFAVPPVNFPVPKPGAHTLLFLVQPGVDGPEPCEDCQDSHPSNNEGRLEINVRVCDLIVTNAFVTRPDLGHPDGTVTFQVANMGNGIAKYGASRLDVFLSPTPAIVGEAFPNSSEIIRSEEFIGDPDFNSGVVAIPPGESVTYSYPISGEWFRDGLNGNTGQTFFTVVRIGRSEDVRAGGTYSGSLVEARADNNVLILPIHVTRPQITKPPVSQSQRLGSAAVFAVEAADFNSFQWLFKGNPIPGETNATLMLTNIQPSATGTYSVMVVNELGSITSDEAVLTVQLPPTVTEPPASQIVGPDSQVTLTVTATGDATARTSSARRMRATPSTPRRRASSRWS